MRKRPVPFYFMLTETEYESLKTKAEDLGISKNEYARSCIFETKIPQINKKDFKDLRFELNRIGNNLNQLTRNSNMGKDVDREELRKLRESFDDIEEKIMNQITGES